MSFVIVISTPILSALVTVGGADMIAGNLVFGYIFVSILYAERLSSKDLKHFLRKRSTITVLVWIILYVIGSAWVITAEGL